MSMLSGANDMPQSSCPSLTPLNADIMHSSRVHTWDMSRLRFESELCNEPKIISVLSEEGLTFVAKLALSKSISPGVKVRSRS